MVPVLLVKGTEALEGVFYKSELRSPDEAGTFCIAQYLHAPDGVGRFRPCRAQCGDKRPDDNIRILPAGDIGASAKGSNEEGESSRRLNFFWCAVVSWARIVSRRRAAGMKGRPRLGHQAPGVGRDPHSPPAHARHGGK